MNYYLYEIDSIIKSSEKLLNLQDKIKENKEECLNLIRNSKFKSNNINCDTKNLSNAPLNNEKSSKSKQNMDNNNTDLNAINERSCFHEEDKLNSILFSNKSKLLIDTFGFCFKKSKFIKEEYTQYKLLKIKIEDKLDYNGINECIKQRFLSKIDSFENSVIEDFNR